MRFEGFVWLIVGGLISLLGIYYIVEHVVHETEPILLGFGFFLGFVAFFFIGLGFMMMIKEIGKSTGS